MNSKNTRNDCKFAPNFFILLSEFSLRVKNLIQSPWLSPFICHPISVDLTFDQRKSTRLNIRLTTRKTGFMMLMRRGFLATLFFSDFLAISRKTIKVLLAPNLWHQPSFPTSAFLYIISFEVFDNVGLQFMGVCCYVWYKNNIDD